MEKEIKKLDSTTHLGRAERYIKFEADFLEFLRKNKYSKKEIMDVDIHDIQKQYNIDGFVFGNYVSQEERYFFLFRTKKQLEYLADISNNKNLGKGILKIGFGADGRRGSLAHYNPLAQYINLNKGGKLPKGYLQGEDSLVHEFAHFVDFMAGRSDKNIPYNFASEAKEISNAKTALIVEMTAIATSNKKYMEGLAKEPNANYLMQPWEIFARIFETTIYYMSRNDLFYSKHLDLSLKSFNDARYLSKDDIMKSNAFSLAKKILKAH